MFNYQAFFQLFVMNMVLICMEGIMLRDSSMEPWDEKPFLNKMMQIGEAGLHHFVQANF